MTTAAPEQIDQPSRPKKSTDPRRQGLTEKLLPDTTPGKDLWTQLVAELGEDTGELSAQAVSPEQIASWHESANMLARKSVVLACAIGLALRERKKQLAHGEFQAWVEENCPFSYPRAATYMRIAKKIEQNYRARHFRWQTMSIREVDRLLPGPARKERAKKTPCASSSDTTPSMEDSSRTSTPDDATPAETNGRNVVDDDAGARTKSPPEVARAESPLHDVESAMAVLVADIEASQIPQARAGEFIGRLASIAGLSTHATKRVIVLRPLGRAPTRVETPGKALKVPVPASVAKGALNSRRTVKFKDLQSGQSSGA